MSLPSSNIDITEKPRVPSVNMYLGDTLSGDRSTLLKIIQSERVNIPPKAEPYTPRQNITLSVSYCEE